MELNESRHNSVRQGQNKVRKDKGFHIFSPKEMMSELRKRGFVGQDRAVRTACVLMYRHLRKRERMGTQNNGAVGIRENYLFVGPTGSGKTFLVEQLCDIVGLPFVIADMTQLSETGYVGEDVSNVLVRLIDNAGGDVDLAGHGIICLDEFDKLAGSTSNARFAGAGTTKDVGGFGVQKDLLTLLSAWDYTIPAGFLGKAGSKLRLDGLTSIACGAFSGLAPEFFKTGRRSRIGFPTGEDNMEGPALENDNGVALQDSIQAFVNYGFIPEIIGRFASGVVFEPLSREVLGRILNDNVTDQYMKEFAREGHQLIIEKNVIQLVVENAYTRQTGARGLHAALRPYLDEAAFHTFGHAPATVRLTTEGTSISTAVKQRQCA